MRAKRPAAAALCLALAACGTPTHFEGVYSPREDVVRLGSKGPDEKLAQQTRWVFFWGLLDDGPVHVRGAIEDKLHPGEVVTHMTVDESSTIPGLLLGWLTLGIVSEHKVVVRGRRTAYPSESDRATMPIH